MKYDLNWDNSSGSIEISFPYDMVKYLPKLDNNTLGVQILRELLGIDTEFDGEYGHTFGFDIGLYQEIHHGILKYQVRLPQYRLKTCDICKGSGKRDPIFGNEFCFCCDGTGEAPQVQHKKILTIRANLKLLLDALNCREYTPGKRAEEPDMKIQLSVLKPDRDSSGIQIPLKEIILLWLQGMSDDKRIEIEEVNNAMIRASDIMSKVRDFSKYSFQTYCQNGRLTMNVPGNATGIYMGGFVGDYGTMYCHNMDSGVQQLSILAGLAQLHSMFREATADIGTKLMERQLNVIKK